VQLRARDFQRAIRLREVYYPRKRSAAHSFDHSARDKQSGAYRPADRRAQQLAQESSCASLLGYDAKLFVPKLSAIHIFELKPALCLAHWIEACM
jgi:hypothetical protein